MVRTTIIPHSQTVILEIPKEYIGKEVEVIAFAKESNSERDEPTGKKVSFDAISIDTKGYKFDRNEANER